MYPYIDDCLYILEGHNALVKFQFALNTIKDLGLPVNVDKLVYPSRRMTCFSIDIDLDRNTLQIEAEKLKEILFLPYS